MVTRQRTILLMATLLLLVGCQVQLVEAPGPESAGEPYAETLTQYVDLYQAVQPLPLVTQSEPGFTYDDAYNFQEQFVAQLTAQGGEPVGYKLGLTGPERPFGAEEPLYGRIFDFMLRDAAEPVQLDNFVRAMLELEMAFYFTNDVPAPVTVEALQDAVGSVAPAVELPDLLFDDMQNLSWLDLIATGVAPRQVIIGEPMPFDAVDVNAVSVVAENNGEMVAEGVGSNVLGDQWAALAFLAEKLNERGQGIQAGDVVISGAMAPMIPLAPGAYTVNYGALGTLEFSVEE